MSARCGVEVSMRMPEWVVTQVHFCDRKPGHSKPHRCRRRTCQLEWREFPAAPR